MTQFQIGSTVSDWKQSDLMKRFQIPRPGLPGGRAILGSTSGRVLGDSAFFRGALHTLFVKVDDL